MHGHRRPLPKYNTVITGTESNNKWDCLKLRSFCKAKDIVNKTKKEWENNFTNQTTVKGLISKIYKELKKLDIKILNNPIKTWVLN